MTKHTGWCTILQPLWNLLLFSPSSNTTVAVPYSCHYRHPRRLCCICKTDCHQSSSADSCWLSRLRSSACRSRINTRLSKSTPAPGSPCGRGASVETCRASFRTNQISVTGENNSNFNNNDHSCRTTSVNRH